jgi:hypothetical protein
VIHVPWFAPAVAALLLALLTGDPTGSVDRRHLGHVALGLVGLLVTAALWATALLIADLSKGVGNADHPDRLLAPPSSSGPAHVTFGRVYWLLDGGGPARRSPASRARRVRVHPAMSRARAARLAPAVLD